MRSRGSTIATTSSRECASSHDRIMGAGPTFADHSAATLGRMRPFKASDQYAPMGDQPRAIERDRRVGLRREPLPDDPRRDRHRQDGDDGVDDREAPAPRARHRPQQDARRAALQRVPRVLPRQRGRVLRLVLRLLPARGVHPAGGSLHREGLVSERRHRAPAAVGDVVAPHPARRRRHRLRLVHLRPRLARGVARARADARGGGDARPRRGAAEADREPVRAQRHGARARPLPGEGRPRRDPAREHRDGVPGVVLRRRGRADHALRLAHGRGVLAPRQPRHLARDRVRDVDARRSSARSTTCARSSSSRWRSSSTRAGCSRRTGSASARSTTSR